MSEIKRVLVTGGTGTLGSRVVRGLIDSGIQPVVLSRNALDPIVVGGGAQWARGDLAIGQGLVDALTGIDAVVHAATKHAKGPIRHDASVDVGGTRSLLAACRSRGIERVCFISIVGIDRAPIAYYRSKAEAEKLVESFRGEWSILRATQFHNFIDDWLRRSLRRESLRIPRSFRFQPVDVDEVAGCIIDHVTAGDVGWLPEIGGPEEESFEDLARRWLSVRGIRGSVRGVPVFGRSARAMASGALTTDHRKGSLDFHHWLERST